MTNSLAMSTTPITQTMYLQMSLPTKRNHVSLEKWLISAEAGNV